MTDLPAVGYIRLNNHHAGPYLKTLATLPVEITSACAPTVEDIPDIEALPDCRIYESIDALLDQGDIDIALVTLPNRDTPSVIDAVTASGVDVFTEKPAARTASDLRPVAKRIHDREAVVCPAYVWRGHPIAQDVRSRKRNGFFGSIRTIETRYVASRVDCRDTDHYLFDSAASRGGILQWLGVHWLDLVPWLLEDRIVAVHAQLSDERNLDFNPVPDVEDVAILQFRLANGALGTLHCAYGHRRNRYDTAIRIYGTEGRCSWDPLGDTFGFDGTTSLEVESTGEAWPSTPKRTITHDYEPTPGYGGSWGREYVRQFLAASEGRATQPADL